MRGPARDAPTESTRERAIADDRWFSEHWQALVRDYPDRYVAVYEEGVVASHADLVLLGEELRQRGLLSSAVIAFVEAPRPRLEF